MRDQNDQVIGFAQVNGADGVTARRRGIISGVTRTGAGVYNVDLTEATDALDCYAHAQPIGAVAGYATVQLTDNVAGDERRCIVRTFVNNVAADASFYIDIRKHAQV